MKKKIVFAINYFYPDFASTGQLMTELCLELQQEFNITVIAAQSNEDKKKYGRIFYTDRLEGIKIVRLRLPDLKKSSKISRILYILIYFILANIALFKEKNVDIIYSISTPPVLGGLIGTIGKILKGSKHLYNIQDFNPEQAEAISYTKKKWIFAIARWIDKWNCRISDQVVVVGKDMQEMLIKRFSGKKVPDNIVINNWTNEKEIAPLNKSNPVIMDFLERYGLTNKFIIMYSGNLGLYYDLENIIGVTKNFKNFDDLAFVFIGEGAVKTKMVDFVKENNITNAYFIPFQPKEFIKYSLNVADIHLVVNQKGIKGVSVPSKIYGVMAAGKPILGVLEQGTEAQRLIEKSHSGLVVEPQDYDEIKEKILFFYQMEKEHREQMGLNGRRYLEKELSMQNSISKYRNVLIQL